MFIVYEPQCVGPEHVEFNAALLTTVKLAFPSEPVVFCAERSHLKLVEVRLRGHAIESTGIRFVAVRTPPRLAFPLRRFLSEVPAFHRLAQFCRRVGARKLLFSSMTAEGLFALRLVHWKMLPDLLLGVVFHAALETLARRPRRNLLARVFGLRNALRLSARPRLKYVVLAKTFEDRIRRQLPVTAPCLISIEHPYLFPPAPPGMPRALGNSITFGTVGAAKLNKGFASWGEIARSVQVAVGPSAATFVHVGLVVDAVLYQSSPAVRFVTAEGWTDRIAFERELAALDYAVFLYPKDSYILTASGALMDALAFGRPVLAIRNPYFEHCFSLLGDIGYLCDTVDELRALIVNLVTKPPAEHFLRQQANIFRNRERFSAEEVAVSFASEWTRDAEEQMIRLRRAGKSSRR